MNRFVERKSWIYVAVGIVIAVAAALIVSWIMSTGMTSGPLCSLGIVLSEPVYVEDLVWEVEVESIWENCDASSRDLENMGIRLSVNNSTILSSSQLRNGLVASSGEILVFFADNGKVGRIDEGDVFYLINLDDESEYLFGIVFKISGNMIGITTVNG